MQNFTRELESIRNNQLEIQEQKNTTTEIKNSVGGFADNCGHPKRGFVDWRMRQHKTCEVLLSIKSKNSGEHGTETHGAH